MVGTGHDQLKRQLEWQAIEADKKMRLMQIENSKLKHQMLSAQQQQPAHSTASPTSLNSTSYDDFPDDLNPVNFNSNGWMGLVGFEAAGGAMSARRDVSASTKLAESFRSSDSPALTSKATASRFILILVMAGTMIKASQTPERALMSLLSKLQDDVKRVSSKILDCVLQNGSVNILDHVSCVELRPGEFDHGIFNMIVNIQNYITPEAIDDLNNIVEYATSNAPGRRLSSLEQSPLVGSIGLTHNSRH